MSVYRILGSEDYTCPSGEHTFRACAQYDYSSKKITFEATWSNGTWLSPEQRKPATYLPVCPTCGEACSFEGLIVEKNGRTHNVQVSEAEAAAVAMHPVTGEVVWLTGDPTAPLADSYRREGFEKVRFHHFHDLQRFCREHGVVNDLEGDYHPDGDGYWEEKYAERSKKEREQRERYLEEREKVKEAMKKGLW